MFEIQANKMLGRALYIVAPCLKTTQGCIEVYIKKQVRPPRARIKEHKRYKRVKRRLDLLGSRSNLLLFVSEQLNVV